MSKLSEFLLGLVKKEAFLKFIENKDIVAIVFMVAFVRMAVDLTISNKLLVLYEI